MPYWAKPPVTIAKQQIYDGTSWVNQLGQTDGTAQMFIKDSEVITASGSVSASENTGNVRLTFHIGGRKLVQWHVTTDGAADLVVEVSPDGSTWYETPNSISLSSAGEWDDWDFVGFEYVAIKCITSGVGVSAVISAKL